jgi:hypothetical protein
MTRRLQKILSECIRDIETGQTDVEAQLQRYPEFEAELRSLLGLRQGLESTARVQTDPARRERGERKLLSALADLERSDQQRAPTILATRAASLIASIALMAVSTAGVSATLGGPALHEDALSVVGISHAPDAAQNGKDHANENAFEGSDNAGQGIENASETGEEHANENALADAAEGDTSAESATASDDGLDTATAHAADEASAGLETAAAAGPPTSVPPASPDPPDHPTPPPTPGDPTPPPHPTPPPAPPGLERRPATVPIPDSQVADR